MPPSPASVDQHLRELAALRIEINRAYNEEDYHSALKLLNQYQSRYFTIHNKAAPRFLSQPQEDDVNGETGVSMSEVEEAAANASKPDTLTNTSASRPAPTLAQKGKGNSMFTDEHMSFIRDGIFLGDLDSGCDGEQLMSCGVTHVVDLANSVHDAHPLHGHSMNVHYEVSAEEGDWKEQCPSVTNKMIVRVDDTDESPLDVHFDAINVFMKDALDNGGKVLVHCFRGKSRSATVVVQYLMQVQGMDLRTALKVTKDARPSVQLNVGFKKALMSLEKRLWPDREPSIILPIKSRKPVLSSMKRA